MIMCLTVKATIVGSIPTRGNDLLLSCCCGNRTRRGVNLSHFTRNVSKIERKVGKGNWMS